MTFTGWKSGSKPAHNSTDFGKGWRVGAFFDGSAGGKQSHQATLWTETCR